MSPSPRTEKELYDAVFDYDRARRLLGWGMRNSPTADQFIETEDEKLRYWYRVLITADGFWPFEESDWLRESAQSILVQSGENLGLEDAQNQFLQARRQAWKLVVRQSEQRLELTAKNWAIANVRFWE